jgi:hypothetical protein
MMNREGEKGALSASIIAALAVLCMVGALYASLLPE